MKWILSTAAAIWILTALPCLAENYLLNGGQDSQITYQMEQTVRPATGTQSLTLSYVVPESFESPTYRQQISDLRMDFSPRPDKRNQNTDERGNAVVEAQWENPKGTIRAQISLKAVNSVRLEELKTQALYPVEKHPDSVLVYLKGTEQVQIEHEGIRQKSGELSAGAKTQFDVVQKVLAWVVDHMHYVLSPERYDAAYSFETGKGNCQNYSHLSAALMRLAGIPVRIVNGITLKEPYDIDAGREILTMKMAQGRHSWIEVYFSDLGWVPFDPQGTQMFVSNRFIRVETGLDNTETRQDGLIRWTRPKGSDNQPEFQEDIAAEFYTDKIQITGRKTDCGPRALLLTPQVEAVFSKPVFKPLEPSPPPAEVLPAKFIKPFVFGNLEFPENVDFLSAGRKIFLDASGAQELRKNFLVETAEYVTTQGRQYAQTFVLDRPVKLSIISLALHSFAPEGQLWIELFNDREGNPDMMIAASDFLDMSRLPYRSGYNWIPFEFAGQEVVLKPGRYWAALGFSGQSIVNWFFTYGKPVGPVDGTRYKTIFDKAWNRSLNFEFNYRIQGFSAY